MRNWLHDIRKEQDFTMNKVAEAANISESYYSMIESGNRGVPVETAKKIATVLNFSWTRFYEDEIKEDKN